MGNDFTVTATAIGYDISNGKVLIRTKEGVTFEVPKENISSAALELIEKKEK